MYVGGAVGVDVDDVAVAGVGVVITGDFVDIDDAVVVIVGSGVVRGVNCVTIGVYIGGSVAVIMICGCLRIRMLLSTRYTFNCTGDNTNTIITTYQQT